MEGNSHMQPVFRCLTGIRQRRRHFKDIIITVKAVVRFQHIHKHLQKLKNRTIQPEPTMEAAEDNSLVYQNYQFDVHQQSNYPHEMTQSMPIFRDSHYTHVHYSGMPYHDHIPSVPNILNNLSQYEMYSQPVPILYGYTQHPPYIYIDNDVEVTTQPSSTASYPNELAPLHDLSYGLNYNNNAARLVSQDLPGIHASRQIEYSYLSQPSTSQSMLVSSGDVTNQYTALDLSQRNSPHSTQVSTPTQYHLSQRNSPHSTQVSTPTQYHLSHRNSPHSTQVSTPTQYSRVPFKQTETRYTQSQGIDLRKPRILRRSLPAKTRTDARQKLSNELPQTSKLSSELPQTSKLLSELPQTSKLSSELPQTYQKYSSRPPCDSVAYENIRTLLLAAQYVDAKEAMSSHPPLRLSSPQPSTSGTQKYIRKNFESTVNMSKSAEASRDSDSDIEYVQTYKIDKTQGSHNIHQPMEPYTGLTEAEPYQVRPEVWAIPYSTSAVFRMKESGSNICSRRNTSEPQLFGSENTSESRSDSASLQITWTNTEAIYRNRPASPLPFSPRTESSLQEPEYQHVEPPHVIIRPVPL